jgi:hypothetical protein
MKTVTAYVLALVLIGPVVQAQPVAEGDAKLGRARLHWKIIEEWWDGPSHCIRYEAAMSNVVAAHFALERAYWDGSVDAVVTFGDRFPNNMLQDYNALVYGLRGPQNGVRYMTSGNHQRGLVTEGAETHCSETHANIVPTETRFVLRGAVFENGSGTGDTSFLGDLVDARIDIRDVWQHWLKPVHDAAALLDYREGLAALEHQLANSDYGRETEHGREKAWGDLTRMILWGAVQAVQEEPPGMPLPAEKFLPELERLLRRHIREIEKYIPKEATREP